MNMSRMVAAIFAFIAGSILFAPALAERAIREHLGTGVSSTPEGITEKDVRELASLIREHGFSVDLEHICKTTGVQTTVANCRFSQISIGLSRGKSDILAFNVPEAATGVPFVLIFHVAEDLSEIFIVSMFGELVRGYSRGADGRFLRNDEANQIPFKIDAAYWARNIGAVYDGLRIPRPPHRR